MRTKFWLEILKGRDHSGVDGSIIFKWLLGNRIGGCGLDSYNSGQGPVVGFYEHGNKPSGNFLSS
jgi:hypothetical protein